MQMQHNYSSYIVLVITYSASGTSYGGVSYWSPITAQRTIISPHSQPHPSCMGRRRESGSSIFEGQAPAPATTFSVDGVEEPCLSYNICPG